MLQGCPMFHVICTKQGEKGSREVDSYQNSLKSLRPLPSPGKGTAEALVEGWGGEPLAWDQPTSEEQPGLD